MGSVPTNLQSAQMWPIQAQGAVTRINPLSDPAIETNYHNAMEQGRFLESSISDANFQLQEKKLQLQAQVTAWLHMNTLATAGQNKRTLRAILYAEEAITLLKEVHNFQSQIQGLINALTGNLASLITIEQNMLRMIQASLNALANLLNEVCNWGLPHWPSIPNLIPEGMFNFNGFTFAPLSVFAAFAKPNFSFNFSFSQCTLLPPSQLPTSSTNLPVTQYSGNTYGTTSTNLNAPLGGTIVDPTTVTPAQMQATTTPPYYNGDTFSSSTMQGSLPDPSQIISNYQLPSTTYQANIVSVVLPQDVIEPSDADYNNPNLAVRQAALRSDLVHYVTLDQIVASNYDPNLVAAWIFYLEACRADRGGVWIPNFQAAFDLYIGPSYTYLQNFPIPWNNVLGGQGVVDAPTAIPLIGTITALTANSPQQLNILWKLSYLEASLLGYTRSKNYDTGADNNFVSGFTGTDLDYEPTTLTALTTTEVLGAGTAQYPVSCTFPTAIKGVLDLVIAQATTNIANNTAYQSPFPRFNYVYNQFAVATLVDRYTQFWRVFNNNLQMLLLQDPYLVQFTVTYEGSLDAAIDPLGTALDYTIIQTDVATRNRAWLPGQPLLPIPTAPIVTYSNSSSPNSGSNGWTNPPYALDPASFLSRPDIQGQPVPVQIAMLRTNLSYAGLQTFANNMSSTISALVTNTQNQINAASQLGFEVDDDTATTVVPPGAGGVPVAFDSIAFDMTGNVTNPTTFTLQAGGTYAIAGQLNWDVGVAGVRTVTIFQNGMAIYTASTPATQVGPTSFPFATNANVAVGDVFQVVASHNLTQNQNVIAGSFFMMIQSSATTTPEPTVTNAVTPGTTFPADATFAVLTAFVVQPDGGVIPVNPVIPAITNVQVNGSNLLTITANNGFTAGEYVTFANVGNATFLNGQTVQVLASGLSTTQFTANFTHAAYGPTAETQGQALLAIDATGVIAAPFSDGIALSPGTTGQKITAGCVYGGVYQVANSGFTVGGLLYVAADGTLTQDFDSLLTTVGWVICVGRVIATDTFIYEPHIPQRFASLF